MAGHSRSAGFWMRTHPAVTPGRRSVSIGRSLAARSVPVQKDERKPCDRDAREHESNERLFDHVHPNPSTSPSIQATTGHRTIPLQSPTLHSSIRKSKRSVLQKVVLGSCLGCRWRYQARRHGAIYAASYAGSPIGHRFVPLDSSIRLARRRTSKELVPESTRTPASAAGAIPRRRAGSGTRRRRNAEPGAAEPGAACQ